MKAVLGDLIGRVSSGISLFVDDLLLYSNTMAEHVKLVDEVLHRFRKFGMVIALDKIQLGMREIVYLGHEITKNGVRIPKDAIADLMRMNVPKNKTELRRLLGCFAWRKIFIRHYSSIAAPLTDLLASKELWVWSDRCQQAFDDLINAVGNSPTLARPDLSRPFLIETDASRTGLGLAIWQKSLEDGEYKLVALNSAKMQKAHACWSVTEIETLAVAHFCNKHRPYLANGQEHVVISDHQATVKLAEHDGHRSLPKTIQRLLIFIQDLNLKYIYRAGSKQVMSDYASRCENTEEVAPTELSDLRSICSIQQQHKNTISDAHTVSNRPSASDLPDVAGLTGVAKPLPSSRPLEEFLAGRSEDEIAILKDLDRRSSIPKNHRKADNYVMASITSIHEWDRSNLIAAPEAADSFLDDQVSIDAEDIPAVGSAGAEKWPPANILPNIAALSRENWRFHMDNELRPMLISSLAQSDASDDEAAQAFVLHQEEYDKIKVLQSNSRVVASIIEAVQNNNPLPKTNHLHWDLLMGKKRIPGVDKLWVDRRKVLWARVQEAPKVFRDKIVLPPEFEKPLMRLAHVGNAKGHRTLSATLNELAGVWFPAMKERVATMVASCNVCGAVQSAHEKVTAASKYPSRTFRTLQMDMAYDILPRTKSFEGPRHVLVVIDKFSRYCWMMPTNDLKASTVLHLLKTHVLSECKPNIVRTIEADRGTHFTAREVVDDLKQFGIHMRFGATGHHEAQGLVENRIRQLRQWIRKLTRLGVANEWHHHLHELVVQMRDQSMQRLGGLSPYAVVRGCNMPRMPLFTMEAPLEELAATPADVVSEFLHRRDAVRASTRIAYSEGLKHLQQSHDALPPPKNHEYRTGDLVFIAADETTHKSNPYWVGPYRVEKFEPPQPNLPKSAAFVWIKLSKGRKPTQRHVTDVRPYLIAGDIVADDKLDLEAFVNKQLEFEAKQNARDMIGRWLLEVRHRWDSYGSSVFKEHCRKQRAALVASKALEELQKQLRNPSKNDIQELTDSDSDDKSSDKEIVSSLHSLQELVDKEYNLTTAASFAQTESTVDQALESLSRVVDEAPIIQQLRAICTLNFVCNKLR